MTFLFINSKALWKHIFYDTILIFQQISSRSSQMFFKIGILKIRNNHRKTPVLEPLFKLQTWKYAALWNRDSSTDVSMAFFIKHLRWLLLNKVKINVKRTRFILLPDWLHYFIKSIMTLNSKHIAKLQRYRNRNTKN